MKEAQKERIVELLRANARLSDKEIAERLNLREAAVHAAIADMENAGILMGYTAIVNVPDDGKQVRAIIDVEVQPERDAGFNNVAEHIARFPEVVAVYLVSGKCDLRLEVVGSSLQDVANFVAAKLSSQDGVKSTATSFLLKKYKESGVCLTKEEKNERLQIVP